LVPRCIVIRPNIDTPIDQLNNDFILLKNGRNAWQHVFFFIKGMGDTP
jgi:hypothetical protein